MYYEENNHNRYPDPDCGLVSCPGSFSACRHFYGKSGNLYVHRACTRKGKWACNLAFAATVSDVTECCGTSFRFAGIFSDVLELDFLHGCDSGRTDAFRHAGSVGVGAVFFSRKKNGLPAVHSCDDDAVSGHDAVAISGVKSSWDAG